MANSDAQPAFALPATESCGDDFVRAVEHALAAGDPKQISDAEIARVMTAAVRLYSAKVDIDGAAPAPVEGEKLTPTDIVVTVSAMIKAVGLNLWDLSMWFQRPPSR
jgi:hypothetical protein